MDRLIPASSWNELLSEPKETPFDTEVDYIEATEEDKYTFTSRSITVDPAPWSNGKRIRLTKIVLTSPKFGRKTVLFEEPE